MLIKENAMRALIANYLNCSNPQTKSSYGEKLVMEIRTYIKEKEKTFLQFYSYFEEPQIDKLTDLVFSLLQIKKKKWKGKTALEYIAHKKDVDPVKILFYEHGGAIKSLLKDHFLRSSIREYLKHPTSYHVTERLRMEILNLIFEKRSSFMSLYRNFEDVQIEYDKKGRLKSPQIEELTNRAFMLLYTKKRKWIFAKEMTGFEYINREEDEDSVIFLFHRGGSAIRTLIEEDIRIEAAGSRKKDMLEAPGYSRSENRAEEMLKVRDNVRRALNLKEYFIEISTPEDDKYGLKEWGKEKYEKGPLDSKKLERIHINHNAWNNFFWWEKVRQILEQANCFLTYYQVVTICRKQEGLMPKELTPIDDKDGKEIDPIQRVEREEEAYCQLPKAGEDMESEERNQEFNEFIKNEVPEEEIAIFKSLISKGKESWKKNPAKEVAINFGVSDQTIYNRRDKFIERIRKKFPIPQDREYFLSFLAKFLEDYTAKLNCPGEDKYDKANNL